MIFVGNASKQEKIFNDCADDNETARFGDAPNIFLKKSPIYWNPQKLIKKSVNDNNSWSCIWKIIVSSFT